jgi:hypothetical protein
MFRKITFIVMSFWPRKLPIGMTTFEAWVTDLIRLSGLPDNATTRNAAASFILQMPPTVSHIPLRVLAKRLIKAAANQVAAAAIKASNEPK